MRPSVVIAVALTLVACLGRQGDREVVRAVRAANPAPLLIRDVTVFTATSEAALPRQDVLLRDGRIVAVVPTGALSPGQVEVIEGRGRTLLPGLVDAHVHLTGSAAPPWRLVWDDPKHNLAAHLYAGVTTVYDMGGDEDALRGLQQKLTSGEWPGPRVLWAGRILTAKGAYPGNMIRALYPWPASSMAHGRIVQEIGSREEAERAVREHKEAGASFIKIAFASVPRGAPRLSPELFEAIVAAAHRNGLKAVTHIDDAEGALIATRANVDGLVHGPHASELPEDAAREIAQRAWVIPTLVTFDRIDQLATTGYTPNALERELMDPEYLASFAKERVEPDAIPAGFQGYIRHLGQEAPHRAEAVKRLAASGARLAAGSDASGSVGCLPGGALHDELRLLVAAGLSPAQALLSATANAARLFSDAPDFGTVEVGKAADLLLVEGDPLADIASVSRIVAVIRNGRLVERAVLKR